MFKLFDRNKKIWNFQNDKKTNKIFLILGQSNAANYGSKLFKTQKEVYCLYKKKIYRANDPIQGASGTKGSPWILFSEFLIDSGFANKILLVNIAEGSSSIREWSDEGKLHNKLISTIDELKKMNLEPNFVLWQQGEQDNLMQTSKNMYKYYLKNILGIFKLFSVNIPIYISITSYCPISITPVNQTIRNAQKEIIFENSDTFSGPDTDIYISEEDRFDGIHFSETGIYKIANAWKDAITGMKLIKRQ